MFPQVSHVLIIPLLQAIKNTPKNPKALRRKSWALKEQGMFSQARKALGELELIDPNCKQYDDPTIHC